MTVYRIGLRYQNDQSDRVPPGAVFICLIVVRRAAVTIGRRHLPTPTTGFTYKHKILQAFFRKTVLALIATSSTLLMLIYRILLDWYMIVGQDIRFIRETVQNIK